MNDSGEPPVHLPARVRRSLTELAAEVLSSLDEADVSPALRRVRGFAPAQRARAGTAPLGIALERDVPFRRRVALAWRLLNPELAEELDAGPGPLAAPLDPQAVAVGSYLCRPDGWQQQLARALSALTADETTARRPAAGPGPGAEPGVDPTALEQATGQIAAAQATAAQLAEELTTLRREQRRLRADADRARSATRAAQDELAAEREHFARTLAGRDEALTRAQQQSQDAADQLAAARQAAKDGRSLADLRARLLLDTIVQSASELRRELALPPASGAPAQLVADQLDPGRPAVFAVPARGLEADDPALLGELLKLPRAHLIVDGYNVTMEGYGSLPLIDQRRLLVDALSALAARTSAEITCCFDGAELDARSQKLERGVRVLFSDPGMTADELIRRLVGAEPRGRVLVVVSSDAEVAQRSSAAGARPVPSTALLRLLGSGRRDRRR